VSFLLHAARGLRRSPGFATAAILTMALGIGLNAAMFGVIDGLFFRAPDHIVGPDRVRRVLFLPESESRSSDAAESTDYPTLLLLRQSNTFQSVAGYLDTKVSIGRGREAIEADARLVTPEFFSLLGLRHHTVADNRVALSQSFWQTFYGADPHVVGKPILIDGVSYAIASILPADFHALESRAVDVWLPIEHASAIPDFISDWRSNAGSFWLQIIARLTPGTLHSALEQRWRSTKPLLLTSIVAGRRAGADAQSRVSLWLAALSTFVLLIACANVSNLVLARNVARRQQYLIRAAVGAARRQLLGQFLAEIVAIAVPAMAASLCINWIARTSLPVLLPLEIPHSTAFLDARSTLIIVGTSTLAFVIVALVSLAQTRNIILSGSAIQLIRASSATTTPAASARFTRNTLLGVQAALSLALLFCAGLFARSLSRVQALDVGVDLDRTLHITINFPQSPASAAPRDTALARATYDLAMERLRVHPRIERAALAQEGPFHQGTAVGPWTLEHSFEELWRKRNSAFLTHVGAGFFAAVGATSLRGRDFTADDRAGSQPVAILNEPLARLIFENADPLGRCIFVDESVLPATHPQPTCVRVIGILAGFWKFRVLWRDQMVLYLPLAQTSIPPGALLVRVRGQAKEARAVISDLRAVVQSVAPNLPAATIRLTRDFAEYEYTPWRTGMRMFSAFAALALVLAALGLYAVVSFTTTMRLREVAIRLALGARSRHIMKAVASEALVAVTAGLIVGALLSLSASRYLGELLFQTSPRDPATLAQTIAVLLTVALLAIAIPVMRAVGSNPATILRAD
jgi:putative ABC transport system permease protein